MFYTIQEKDLPIKYKLEGKIQNLWFNHNHLKLNHIPSFFSKNIKVFSFLILINSGNLSN